MANSQVTTALTWSAATSRQLTTTARVDTDEVNVNANALVASVQCSVSNPGTAATGDFVDFYVRWSLDGTVWDSDEHSLYLGRLDTVNANDPGENPAIKTWQINVGSRKKFKIIAKAQNAVAGRQMTISGFYSELQVS